MFERMMATLQQWDVDMVDSKAQVFYDERAVLHYKNMYDNLAVSVGNKVINDKRRMFSSFFNMQDFQWSVCTKLFKKSSIGEIKFDEYCEQIEPPVRMIEPASAINRATQCERESH